jgi:hypothetical protein
VSDDRRDQQLHELICGVAVVKAKVDFILNVLNLPADKKREASSRRAPSPLLLVLTWRRSSIGLWPTSPSAPRIALMDLQLPTDMVYVRLGGSEEKTA